MHIMELHLPIFMISLILFAGFTINCNHVSGSTPGPEMYWKSVLPNTPMPNAIKNSLRSVDDHGESSPFRLSEVAIHTAFLNDRREKYGKSYHEAANQELLDDIVKNYGDLFMFETHMVPGRTIEVRWFTNPDDKATILPHKVSESIPFSSDKLPEIFTPFSIDPKSREAAAIESTIKGCEEVQDAEKSKYCAKSLESLISFIKSRLGNNVNSISSTSSMKSLAPTDTGKRRYRIREVEKIADYETPTVVCHKEVYPYAVFYCHEIKNTAAYVVSLVGDGIDVKAVAVCHKDTSKWNPKHLSFKLLKVKPGKTTPICHFLEEYDIVWTKKDVKSADAASLAAFFN